jgi:hypothetical protein
VYLASKPVLSNLGIYGQEPTSPQARHFLDLVAHKAEREEVDAIFLRDGDNRIGLRKDFPETVAAPVDTVSGAPAAPAEPDRSVWEWRLTEPRAAAAVKTRADAVLNAVCTLRAVDVVDPTADLTGYGLTSPSRTAELEFQDGTKVTLAFGDAREAEDDVPAGVYLRVGDEPTVWVVGDYVTNNVFKTSEELLPEAD